MSRLFISLMVFIVSSGACASDRSYFMTGNELLEWCDKEDISSYNTCAGYIAGLNDAFAVLVMIENTATLNETICMPTGITASQLVKVFKKYLNEQPEQTHLVSSTLFLLAMSSAFQCNGEGI